MKMRNHNPEIDPEMKEFGKYIRICRKAKRLTQQQIADLLEITPKSVSCMERGMNYPSPQNLFRLIRYLDMSIDEFVFGYSKYDGTLRIAELNSMLDRLDPADRITLINISKTFCESLLQKKEA